MPRGWLLKVVAVAFGWPLVLALVRGSLRDAVALVAAMVLLWAGGEPDRPRLPRGGGERGPDAGAEPTCPGKLFGAIAAGVAAFSSASARRTTA